MMPMKIFPLAALSGLTLVSITFSGCETPGQGAGTGAAAGAIIGGIAGGNIRSAAIGAAAGAATGALVGAARQDERRREYIGYEEDRAYAAAGYPYRLRVADLTDRPGFVVSPYRPHALVDVRGFQPGSHIVDPVSQRVFIVP
jgi:hypothetical protein